MIGGLESNEAKNETLPIDEIKVENLELDDVQEMLFNYDKETLRSLSGVLETSALNLRAQLEPFNENKVLQGEDAKAVERISAELAKTEKMIQTIELQIQILSMPV